MSRDLPADHVEARRDQWRRELPDVDTRGMSILGRARWISLKVRPPIEAVFAEHDLDTGEFDVLSTLLRSGAPYQLRPTELYTALMISSGGLTARLGKLEKAKLVERLPAEDDGRVLLVRLTPEGRSRAEAAFRQDMAVEAALLEGLNDEEQAQLARLLWKLSLEIAKPGPDA
jgi:DNA-binding MarR family transcriptional regulator